MRKDQKGPWSRDERELFKKLVADGKNKFEIADITGRSPRAVETQAYRLHKGELKYVRSKRQYRKDNYTKPETEKDDSKVKERSCLRCGKRFESQHFGHRICSRHTDRGFDEGSWIFDSYGLPT